MAGLRFLKSRKYTQAVGSRFLEIEIMHESGFDIVKIQACTIECWHDFRPENALAPAMSKKISINTESGRSLFS